VEAHPDKIFLFGDNFADRKTGYVPSSTQAVIRGLPNALGIATKFDRFTNPSSYFTDSEDHQNLIEAEINNVLF
jgi:hypothetical protein